MVTAGTYSTDHNCIFFHGNSSCDYKHNRFVSADNSADNIHPALLMQAHLVGWAAGTMSSVASLSVLTCSNLFQVESRKLAFGPNLLTAVFFSLSSGVLLSFVNSLIY